MSLGDGINFWLARHLVEIGGAIVVVILYVAVLAIFTGRKRGD